MIDDSFPSGSIYSDVVLSEYEREVLARLAAGVDDPWLASQLLGGIPAPPKRRFSIPSCWVGITLLLLGASLALATFHKSLWACGFAIAVMAAGGTMLVVPARRRPKVRPLVRPISERGQWAPHRPRNWLS